MSARIFKLSVLLVFVASCLSCARSCESGPEAAYRFEAGQNDVYTFFMTQQVEVPDQDIESKRLILRFRMTIKTEKLLDQGAALRSISLADISAAISSVEGREPLEEFKGLESLDLAFTQTAKGDLQDIEIRRHVPASLASMEAGLLRSLREALPNLPTRLSHGTAWSRKVEKVEQIPGVGERLSTTLTRYEAGEMTSLNGVPAQKIAAHFTIRMDNPDDGTRGPQGEFERFSLEGTGSGDVYFDPKAGRFVAASYETAVTVRRLSGTPGNVNDQKQTIRSHIDIQPYQAATKKARPQRVAPAVDPAAKTHSKETP